MQWQLIVCEFHISKSSNVLADMAGVVFALRVLNVLVVGDPQVRRNCTGGHVPGDGEETWVHGFYPGSL